MTLLKCKYTCCYDSERIICDGAMLWVTLQLDETGPVPWRCRAGWQIEVHI